MIDILITGDISLHGRVENPLKNIYKSFKKSSLVIGNLERPLEPKEISDYKPSMFCHPDALGYLKEAGFTHLTLANNHIFDGGIEGLKKTIDVLSVNNIKYFGAGLKGQQTNYFTHLIDDTTLTFINAVSMDTNPSIPLEEHYLSLLEEDNIKKIIRQHKLQSNIVILLLHWGGMVEGGCFPAKKQIRLARSFIKAGADLIIGHHSHTVQLMEIYRGKRIYYGLGDLVNNTVYKKGPMGEKRKKGLVVGISILRNNLSIFMHLYISKEDGIPHIVKVTDEISDRHILLTLITIAPLWSFFYTAYLRVIEPLINFIFFNPLSLSQKLEIISKKSILKIMSRITHIVKK